MEFKDRIIRVRTNNNFIFKGQCIKSNAASIEIIDEKTHTYMWFNKGVLTSIEVLE